MPPYEAIHILPFADENHLPCRRQWQANVADYAQSLFARLHACDNARSEIILVEAPPKGAQWDGIWDRLKRASS